MIRNTFVLILLIAVATIVVVKSAEDGSKTSFSPNPNQVPQAADSRPAGLYPPNHVFSKGIVRICAYTPGITKKVKFSVRKGEIFKTIKPGYRLVESGPARRSKITKDNSPDSRFRWCGLYEAPFVKKPQGNKKVWEYVSVKVQGKVVDSAHFELLPDQF